MALISRVLRGSSAQQPALRLFDLGQVQHKEGPRLVPALDFERPARRRWQYTAPRLGRKADARLPVSRACSPRKNGSNTGASRRPPGRSRDLPRPRPSIRFRPCADDNRRSRLTVLARVFQQVIHELGEARRIARTHRKDRRGSRPAGPKRACVISSARGGRAPSSLDR